MQTLTLNDESIELQLTAGVAVRLKAHDSRLAILDDPGAILAAIYQPETLLPIAVAMAANKLGAIKDWENIADDFDGEKYDRLREAVESEIVDFFHGKPRERLQRLIDLTNQDRANQLDQLALEIQQDRQRIERGSTSSGNGPEQPVATGDTPPLENSTSPGEDSIDTPGTTPPDSSAQSTTEIHIAPGR